jgi:hypothetical protein
LTEPVPYPAQGPSIEALLTTLERLTPAARITAPERRNRAGLEEEQGFTSPYATILLQQGDPAEDIGPVDIGARTAPGDQVYVRVAGQTDVYVVSADLLKEIPHTKDDWRDTTLVDLRGVVFDRLVVTNGAKVLELQLDQASRLWRITSPDLARANAARIRQLLEKLQMLQVSRFVSDKAESELEAYGLQPPALEITVARGTNPLVRLQFGKSPTNDPGLVYARRWGANTVVTVPTNALASWQEPVSAFRDPRVVELPDTVASIEVKGQESFSVQRAVTNGWRILPQNWPGDAAAVQDLLARVGNLTIQDAAYAVPAPALAKYGLTAPAYRYIFRAPAPPGATNPILVEVQIGGTTNNMVFVRRPDENSVYAVAKADLERLPTAGFQLRERRIWSYTDDDVLRVTAGKTRQFVHNGKGLFAWALTPGSEGSFEPLGVGQTVLDLTRLTATNWVAHGETNRARFGLTGSPRQVCLELNNGQKPVLELGGISPDQSLYGAVTLDGEPWIFEFPVWLAQRVRVFLFAAP